MIPAWIWPKNFWRRMFEWGPKGNCYGPQPNELPIQTVERYFGVTTEQIAHNIWPDKPFHLRRFDIAVVMEELYRQIDVNHGAVR